MALAHGEVIRIVRRRDLHRAGTELAIHVIIGDDLNLQVLAERVVQNLAHQVRVALILRVHGNCHVTQHRLHTSRRHNNGVFPIAVAEGHELAFSVLVLDLNIRDCSLQHRRPVDHALGAVNQAAVKQFLKNRLHRTGQALVQSEALTGPIQGVTNLTHLVADTSAVIVLPLPDLLHEFLAAIIEAVLTFGLLQHRLDLGLRCDTRVVHTRQPQHLVALHALTSHQRIHQGVVQCVAHVQLTRHIRWGQHNRVSRLGARRISLEITGVYPALVQVRLHVSRVPRLGQLICSV